MMRCWGHVFDGTESEDKTRLSIAENVNVSGGADDVNLSGGFEYPTNHVLIGRYRVLAVLGRGGMGVVYGVQEIASGREFALKTINKRLLSDFAVRRFQQEARACFAVNHPNIVNVSDFGVLEDETPFLVMEVIKGETLSARLKRLGPMSPSEAVPMFIQVCLGLAHAHENGIIHRDIKPSNIMLLGKGPVGSEGSIKILDFGVAKVTQQDTGEIQALTKTGEIFGSPLYMSPEQCAGGKIDARADVYSLGCVLFETLTGTTPFVGENSFVTMMMHQSDRIPTLKEASLGEEFSEELERVAALMLAKRPEDRYQNLAKAANDLARINRGEALSVGSSSSSQRQVKNDSSPTVSIHLTRGQLAIVVVGVAGISAFLATAAGYFFHSEQSTPVQSQTQQHQPVRNKVTKSEGLDSMKDLISAVSKRTDRFKSPEEIKKMLRKSPTLLRFHNANLPKEFFDTLADLNPSKLVHLDVMHSQISNEHMDRLSELPLLRVSFIDTNLNDRGARALARCQNLESIKIGGTKISDEGLKAFSKLKNLNRMDFNRTLVTANGVRTFCRLSPAKIVAMGECENVTDEERKQLQKEFPAVQFEF